jgi:hypothetical protein
MNKNIAQYEVEDFVLEDSFRNWVLESDSLDHFYWEEYRSKNPQQGSVIETARHLIVVLNSLYDTAPDPEIVNSIWRAIEAKINAEPVGAH